MHSASRAVSRWRDQSEHRRHSNSTGSGDHPGDSLSSGCRVDPGTNHGLDQSCSRGASATAHRRTNCGRHRAAQDYAENTRALFDVFYGDNAETLTTAVTSSKLFVGGWSECFAEKLPMSTKRVSWMSGEEVECCTKEFERAGGDPHSEQWMDSDHV